MALIEIEKKRQYDGVFKASFLSGHLQIAAGAVGDILIITPPSGQRVRLSWLTCSQPSTVRVLFNGASIIQKSLTSQSTITGRFIISNGSTSGTSSGIHEPIVGAVDEVLTINATSATAGIIQYGYEFGV